MEVSVYRADPTTWLDFITAISPIIGALLAVGGVLLTIRYTNRRERDRQDHERLLKDAELEAHKESRLRDERIAAYRKLLAAATTAHDDREAVNELGSAYAEISLLSITDEIDQSSKAVWLSYWRAQKAYDREKEDPEIPSSVYSQALDRAATARDRFLALARKELGTKGRSASFRDLEGDSLDEELPGLEKPS